MVRGTIVYVHGASDRAANVDDHVARIERQLTQAGLDFRVLASRWGEVAGADLGRIEAALPAPPAPRGAPVSPPAEPPFDLAQIARLAAGAPEAYSPALALGHGSRQSDELLEICRTRVGAPGESITLRDGEAMRLDVACRAAAESVGRSPDYAAARSSPIAEAVLVDAVGRAVASNVASLAAAPQEVAQTVEVRIAEAVLGAALATILANYLGIDVGPDLKRWATDVLLPHRARLIREAGLGPADILLYQRDGAAIRRVVRTSLEQAAERGGPVIALGNSLGGIILVDVLAAPSAPRPDLLVTVGSQAPLLATFGALAPLGGPGSPPPFQPWLNIYDRRDLLGFVAGRVWPAPARIVDHEVDLGVGFPDAHGAAYLESAEVFAEIRRHLATDGPGVARRWRIDARQLSAAARFVLGASAANSYVELDDVLRARLGRFDISSPANAIVSWRRVAGGRGRTLLGIVGALLGGVAALGSGSDALRIELSSSVRWSIFRLRALELAVDHAETLERALEERQSTAA